MKAKTGPNAPRRSGRPSKDETGRIRDKILDIAAGFFFTEGYGATSIEAIAKRARISKRTIYHRFDDKPEIFKAVVHRMVVRMRPTDTASLFEGAALEDILLRIAVIILKATVSPEALSVHRVMMAEAMRFPELAIIASEQGARQEAIMRIAGLLEREARAGQIKSGNALFAAEQFIQMVVAVPQRRAMGMGKPMTPEELQAWAEDTVHLFLNGCKN